MNLYLESSILCHILHNEQTKEDCNNCELTYSGSIADKTKLIWPPMGLFENRRCLCSVI